MKSILWLALICIAFISKAQDFKNVSKFAIIGQMELAKTELDKVMSDPKAQSKPDGWFWKTKIYAYFYKDEVLHNKYPKAAAIADEAYQKYIAIEPSLKILKDNNGQDALFNLYAPSFNSGIAAFNAKNWDSAFYYFDFASKYSDVIFQNKFSTNQNATFDTTSLLYAGFAAQNASKPDNAVKYYKRLINSNVAGANYLDIYKYTLVHEINSKNEADFKKYLAISKSLYPKEDFEDYELNYFTKNYSLADKEALYIKEDAAGTMSAKKYLQYGDIFANISKEDKANIDSLKLDEYLKKAADAFKKAAQKNPSDGIAAFNAGVIYYNFFGILDDKVSVSKRALQELNTNRVVEKDPKKKAIADAKFNEQSNALKNERVELEKPLIAAADESIQWLEKAYTVLKEKTDRNNIEKNCLSKSVDYLSNIFIYKRDKSRGKDAKAYDEFDAKFKLYDSLHGKF